MELLKNYNLKQELNFFEAFLHFHITSANIKVNANAIHIATISIQVQFVIRIFVFSNRHFSKTRIQYLESLMFQLI